MKLIKGKITAPQRGLNVASRARLTAQLHLLAHRHGVVLVTGTAGSGKTTAVGDAFLGSPALVWLSLDQADSSPGRLLAYLEAAIASVVPEAQGVATEALAMGLPHTDAASLLAEAIAGAEITIVLDEVEHVDVGGAAAEVISAFLRYLPTSIFAVLISRRRPALLHRDIRAVGGIGRVTDEDLRFTVEEAAAALNTIGRPDLEPERAVEATGGWVAGVLFEAWRSSGHVHGAGGESDALSGYLSSEIMSDLSPVERHFLVATSLLDEVTMVRASALGLKEATESMALLRQRYLPIVVASDGTSFRCHRQFREFLRSELEADPTIDKSDLHRALGDIHVQEDKVEESVDEYLLAGDVAMAERSISAAILGVIRRGDFELAARWLAVPRREVMNMSPPLVAAQILLAHDHEDYAFGSERADWLLQLPGHGALLSSDPSLVGRIAWCYHLMCRIDDAYHVISMCPPNREIDAVTFAMASDIVGSTFKYLSRPPDCGGATDALLARIDLVHGRLARLLSSPRRAYSSMRSSQVGALLATGRLDEAEAGLSQSAIDDWTMLRLKVEWMIETGQVEEIDSVTRTGDLLLARSGSPVSRMFDLVVRAEWALHVDLDPAEALRYVHLLRSEQNFLHWVRLVERSGLVAGEAYLRFGSDVEAASILRDTMRLIIERDRLLMMPLAGVLLAEAEWRLGEPSAADAAADLALDAATRMGTDHQLLRALRAYPSVLARRLDAEPGEDSRWHTVGRSLRRSGNAQAWAGPADILIVEFGEPAIQAQGGPPIRPKLAKSIELASYLACHGGQATRAQLLEALFDGRADESARSYLRQAMQQLRNLPDCDIDLVADQLTVSWNGSSLTSESVLLESQIRKSDTLHGRERLDSLLAALQGPDRGIFLPNISSDWAEQRRQALDALVTDARISAAEAALRHGEYGLSERLVQAALADDPFRESAWRLSMRVAAELGDTDEVIARFARCREEMAVLGATPTETTVRLLASLRR